MAVLDRRVLRIVATSALALVLAVVLGLVLAAPPGHAQGTTTLKIQAAWPPVSTLWESSKFFAERVGKLSGGRLKIDLLPSGSVVPPFEMLDATGRGVIDGGHAAPAYWVGKNKAAALFGPAPGGPFGMDMLDYLGWLYQGGGLDLYREFYKDVLKVDVVPVPLTAVSNQVLGWFKKPIRSLADLRGVKCRQTGITAEVFTELGMRTVNMAGGEIIPAAERGVIECAEWVGPAEDMKLGFQQVFKHYYMPSLHEPAVVVELLINGKRWQGLPPDFQEIITTAALEATINSQIALNKANASALKELREKHGVQIGRTPNDILIGMLKAWDKIAQQEADRNAFFKKVYDSQRRWAADVVTSRRTVHPAYEVGADYYWPQK
jgi:TRAP-type mannitol/chloroaromatic compound transport system substrate-binding protein